MLALLCDEPELLAIADAIATTQDDSELSTAPRTERDRGADGGGELD